MRNRILAAATVLGAALTIYFSTGTVPDVPASWDVQGGNVETACYAIDVMLPCTGLPAAAKCEGERDLVPLYLRAPTDPEQLPAALRGAGYERAALLVHEAREVPSADCGSAKVVTLRDPSSAWTCLAGDVVIGGVRRIGGRCCPSPGSTCVAGASGLAVAVPPVEIAGHERWQQKLCAEVRRRPSPPAAAVTWCDANVPEVATP